MINTIFDNIINTFENNDIKEFFVKKCLPIIPDYFWAVPASSSGLYHSAISLGEGGLARHTAALVRLMNYMFEVEALSIQFTSRERDLLRIGGLMHDTRKSGTQEDYEKNKHTKFTHPLQAAEAIRGLDGLPKDEIELIAHVIESHMGIWNTSKREPEIVLPVPKDKYQILVHLCDYIVSRKDVEFKFDDMPTMGEEPPTVETWKLTFGKHKGKTLLEVQKEDPSYIYWAKDNVTSEPCKTLVKQL